jgi:hypothetical protein
MRKHLSAHISISYALLPIDEYIEIGAIRG